MVKSHLELLIRKNLTLKYRRCGCIFEILVPIVFFAIAAGVRQALTNEVIPEEHFPVNTIGLPALLTFLGAGGQQIRIAYAPSNTYTDALMASWNASLTPTLPPSLQNYNIFLPFPNYAAMVDVARDVLGSKIGASITFDDLNPDGSFKAGISYSISMCSECTPDTDRTLPGPVGGANGPWEEVVYYRSGFLTVQASLDNAIIQFLSLGAGTNMPLNIQQYPYPQYEDNRFGRSIGFFLSLFMVLSWIYTASMVVKDIVTEKERRLREALRMMGISLRTGWAAWAITSFGFMFISVIFMTIICKGANITENSDGGLMFIFFLMAGTSTLAYCFLVSTFFSRANVASAASGVLYFILYVPYMFVADPERYDDLTRTAKMGISLLVPSAIGIGGKTISQWEERGIGATWSNVNESASTTDSFCMADVFGMFAIDTLLYLVLTWYLDNVRPGRYGVPKPWHFFLHASYWTGRQTVVHASATKRTDDGSIDAIEPAPEGLVPGIDARNLVKVFDEGKKLAIDGLSVTMYENQVTSLLGHNGAGKTTLMSILTGLYAPSSGDAFVGGCSVVTDIEGVRRSLGLCPQFDVLFDNLTVAEHLRFFCRVKGLDESAVEAEVDSMITDLNLTDKRNEPARTLSGGMKRRLSVAIAFVGGSKIVMLDEPTAGMDPHARRATWELILKHKKGRTIILTTHFMDEADLLGDRVAIMAHGRVQCVGSSLFLKARYGVGYHMIAAKEPHCDSAAVTKLVQSYIPHARVENDVGTELSFILPRESATSFPALFNALDDNKEKIGISTYGVSVTTMEEVFLRVGHDADKQESAHDREEEEHSGPHSLPSSMAPLGTDASHAHLSAASAGHSTIDFSAVDADTRPRHPLITGPALRVQHLKAMFLKRVNHSRRDKRAIISQLLVPVVFAILAMGIGKSIPSAGTKPAINFNMASVLPSTAEANVYFNSSDPSNPLNVDFITELDTTVGALGGIWSPTSNMTAALLGSYNEVRNRFLSVGSISVFVGVSNVTGVLHFVPDAIHILPALVNMYDSAALTAAVPGRTIRARNVPLPPTPQEQDLNTRKAGIEFTVAIELIFGMSFLAGSFVSLIVQERIVDAKHLQVLAGADLLSYWLGSFLWDLINFCVPVVIIWVVLAVFNMPQYTGDSFGGIAMLFLFYGWAVIPFVYCVSFLFNTTTTAYVVLILVNIILGLGCVITTWILEILETAEDVNDVLKWLFLVFPIYAFGRGTMDVGYNSALSIESGGFQPKLNPLDWNVAGRNIVFMFFMGIFFFLMLLAIEYRVFMFDGIRAQRQRKKLIARREKQERLAQANNGDTMQLLSAKEDEDVLAERKRVLEGNSANGDVIRIMDLSKVYPASHGRSKVAVDGLTVGIPKNQCFGLLGVNGAGKTTTFKMLTGELGVTSGDAFLTGYSILSDILDARRRIGYCPQFDGILDNLTGTEVLSLYARLRGLDERDIPRIVKAWVDKLELTRFAERPCGTYSGGNKRKLSTAVALIGDPPIIFLDEPTTGMDPKARRFLWNVISNIMTDNRCIVLTSHSMEECEALCTRLGIMVGGKFRCLGSPQHLKSRYGTGYDLMIKINPRADTAPVKTFVTNTFGEGGCKFIEEHNGMVRYEVSAQNLKLASVFGAMEENRASLQLIDYSLSQTSLEQIFLSFASQTHDVELE
ncbi:ATP-binding cassette transporter subfamily A [Capsaspora owczarzaki ATCC 30864]|uniref:ATP-binding cassette transporter subfamily A n=1 Tax=Capsaspora owczarzaki (strain ATCC 30864) TaxID=595528 RepID=A0A0D2WPE2_CAPO3|nr:ATP-binding cassette transporter subfamily A [Capsaspora owczarzaki ATCC 30864]KJE92513.1 ATP-binding cassette transporter subfamily A [Capsaspora owczarzaki ATCC 30864]|eukprot:XP_004348371.1 ATP-binding cassette transporter subfamily A [Capsaspora owczarzaki ATCC 30864]